MKLHREACTALYYISSYLITPIPEGELWSGFVVLPEARTIRVIVQ
jgi:hypothetical protein